MKEQGLYHTRGSPFPQDVSSSDLEKFLKEGNSAGPKLASNGVLVQLDWKKSTRRSEWNGRAVSMLSTELHRLLEGGKVKNVQYDAKIMNLKIVEKQITRRIDVIRRDRIAEDENRLKVEQERTDQIERRRSRRKTVSSSCFSLYQQEILNEKIKPKRHENREKVTTRKEKGGVNKTWTSAGSILKLMKVEGASGDETESEDLFGRRVVRRLRRPWLSHQISALMVAIDSYSMEEKDQAGMRKQGNVGSIRHTMAINDDDRPYMINLPVNFYDSEWFRRLDEYDKVGLNVQPAMEIPNIVSLCMTLSYSSSR